jgi:hypothetical protein
MTHQLVVQFNATTTEEYQRFIDLSHKIEEALPVEALLDGHDFGMGEFNIFIHTNNPKTLFEPVCEVIAREHPDLAFSAGYRSFEEDDYTAIWPRNSAKFSVL